MPKAKKKHGPGMTFGRGVKRGAPPVIPERAQPPRPAWMDDPSLLPKKPPGGRP